MDKFNTLSINQLSIINGGRRHHRSWAKCATGTAGDAAIYGVGGFGVTGGPWGAAIGAAGGALHGASESCF